MSDLKKEHFRQFGSYTFHVKNSSFLCSFCRYTDEKLILATPGPCTVEVRDAASLSQREFIERLIDIQKLLENSHLQLHVQQGCCILYTCILFLFGGLAIDLNKIRSNTIVYMYVHVAYMNSLFYFLFQICIHKASNYTACNR